MRSGWWGIYDNKSEIWRTENPRSNFDDFVGKLICYPHPSIAEAHLYMLTRSWEEGRERLEVREFGVDDK